MKNELYSTDYDIRVGEILTAHEYTFVPGEVMSAFAIRRGFAGLVLALEGECVFHIGQNSIPVHANQVLYLPPDCRYVIENNPKGNGFRHYTVNFVLEEVAGFETVRSLLLSDTPYVTDIAEHTSVRNDFPQLVSAWHSKAPGYRMVARQHLYSMLFDFVSRYVAQLVNPDLIERVMPAKLLIDEKYNEELSITDLAALCGLSETHFRRCFFTAFGMSPIAYRTKLRIERAKDLLLGSWYSVGDISTMTGFSDISFFSRFFTRHTGLSPTVFRREYGTITEDTKEN